ncbi:hypothetical protein ACLB2K_071194 [Fragaria x ananassa]
MESPSNNNCPPRCARGCGFYGSFATNSMCSKCYRDYQKEEELLAKFIAAPSAVAPVEKTLDVGSVSANESSSSTSTTSDDQPSGVTKKRNCCQNESCKKKLTLVQVMSGKCRCEGVFCTKHRFPEEHSCSVNFKETGKEVLAQQNPVCVADKLENRWHTGMAIQGLAERQGLRLISFSHVHMRVKRVGYKTNPLESQ